MAHPKFADRDFLDAALAVAAEHGAPAVTVGAITERLRAPVGSFYHRFPSRDALLGELWLRTVLDFQQGIMAALEAGDGLAASLHTPAWVRTHLDEARLLLLYHRDDFLQGGWPAALQDGVAAQTARMEAGFARFAGLVFGRAGQDEIRRAQFLLVELPVGVVRQHLQRREKPPPIVDELIRITYLAVVEDYRAKHDSAARD
ncbi:MAG: TetR/AcrR family transcriptional regulator [Alphaproteobacteria bacterium]|nr:TetR/AcrR family transcriptional regulator [Alphaproteobacteria bacterium]MBV9150287.1 TetR/AcrR family transcriptional regulator [Alphaproteobacteria bacterium]